MATKELVTDADLIPVLDDGGKEHIELLEGVEHREDANREVRSMLLAVHPCPPLPQIALGGLHFEERIFSSHDFLATAIDRMLVKQDTEFNRSRRSTQHALIMSHFDELEEIDSVEVDMDRLYACFTGFSRKYASVFFSGEEQKRVDIRYKSLDHVCRNDPVHLAACSHLRAYRIMRQQEVSDPKEFEDLSYPDLLRAFHKEIVRKDPEDEVGAQAPIEIGPASSVGIESPIKMGGASIVDTEEPIEIVRTEVVETRSVGTITNPVILAPMEVVETRSVGTTTIPGILAPMTKLLPL
ncbi:hypothetical protein T484DRAFT_1756617 [Baffinella frigidus]|nr:hypothetical protein T484DRAFT_1756617 [Cryptophyta sp. CCMP2293]